MTFRLFNDTGHSSNVEIRMCTKISKDVSNPGNFAGEPPLTEAQPPHAVVKHILNLYFIFPCFYLFLFYFSFYFIIIYFVILFISFVLYLIHLISFCYSFCFSFCLCLCCSTFTIFFDHVLQPCGAAGLPPSSFKCSTSI